MQNQKPINLNASWTKKWNYFLTRNLVNANGPKHGFWLTLDLPLTLITYSLQPSSIRPNTGGMAQYIQHLFRPHQARHSHLLWCSESRQPHHPHDLDLDVNPADLDHLGVDLNGEAVVITKRQPELKGRDLRSQPDGVANVDLHGAHQTCPNRPLALPTFHFARYHWTP